MSTTRTGPGLEASRFRTGQAWLTRLFLWLHPGGSLKGVQVAGVGTGSVWNEFWAEKIVNLVGTQTCGRVLRDQVEVGKGVRLYRSISHKWNGAQMSWSLCMYTADSCHSEWLGSRKLLPMLTYPVPSHCPWGSTGAGSCQPLVTFSPSDQYITLFYVCICVGILSSIYTVDSLTLNSQPTAV